MEEEKNILDAGFTCREILLKLYVLSARLTRANKARFFEPILIPEIAKYLNLFFLMNKRKIIYKNKLVAVQIDIYRIDQYIFNVLNCISQPSLGEQILPALRD